MIYDQVKAKTGFDPEAPFQLPHVPYVDPAPTVQLPRRATVPQQPQARVVKPLKGGKKGRRR